MNSLTNKLQQTILCTHPKIIAFFENRFNDDKYRGIHFSQHNRYTLQDVIEILNAIYKHRKNDYLKILVGDDKGTYHENPPIDYMKVCDTIKGKIGKGSLNSVKKNYFPDLHRMGFINRYDKNKKEIMPYHRISIKYVKISENGRKLLFSKPEEQHFLFCQAIDKISNMFLNNLKNLMYELNINKIDDKDIALFVTGIGKTFSKKHYSYDDIKILLNEWNKFTCTQKNSIIEAIKDWFEEQKIGERDYHNLLNESQQIIHLLSQLPFFEKDTKKYELHWNKKNNNDTSEIRQNCKRQYTEKNKYLKEHHLQNKSPEFDFHHIIPLCEAKTANAFKQFDCWENLIYIKTNIHSKLTRSNKYRYCFKLIFNNSNDIQLISIKNENTKLNLKCSEDVLYDPKLKEKMKNKNSYLLKTF